MQRIVFPDATAAVIGALNTQLPAVGFAAPIVRTAVPNPRPAQFVLVFRTGGVRGNLVTDDAQVTTEAWAASHAEAHDLAQAARAIIHSLEGTVTGGVTFYNVADLSGPAFLPDPDSEQSRFTFSSIVGVRFATAA